VSARGRVYPAYWATGPCGVLTREELAAEGLAPGGQPAVAWRRSSGSPPVPLFARAAAVPARPSTLAELAVRATATDPERSRRAVARGPRSVRRWRCAARAA
jgi:hypothetical protein